MKVLAPGKLILSGEHAVVHGAPAIAMAVNRYATTTVTRSHLPRISFDFTDVTHQSQLSFNALKTIKQRIKRKYQRFVSGDFSIREVLQKPFELAQFAMGLFTDSLNLSIPHGVKVQVTSEIPVGCGMGSSAATILSVIQALSSYLESPISSDTLFKLALEAENMQHGFSSGLDLRVAMQGGCIYVNNDHIEKREAPSMPMYLVNSGVPKTTTGECVEAVSAYFKQQNLLDEFTSVTNAIDQAIQTNNYQQLQEHVRLNHLLLTRIGVVPEKIQRFIAEIEKADGAAKICGAGAIKGDHAGAVLVLLEDVNHLESIAKQYGYGISLIEADKTAWEINEATYKALMHDVGEKYIGVLYGSFIATKDGIYVIEFNARFGDPEALNVLTILESDLVAIYQAMVTGNLTHDHVQFARQATVCKYAVPDGYPDDPVKNQQIDISAVSNKSRLYLAAVDAIDGKIYERGSRTAAYVGVASSISCAEEIAEKEVRAIGGPLFHRADIGTDKLIQKRIDDMRHLRQGLE